ncbi:lectin subunit alpha-like [Lucilia sericata]|uniref:lectin subunit alpha-like n=1 Tax=Lucilia sericata TaxID=13632 RepID=UPI0018A8533E|nr:lectin subunit alpha-like [Lucilia sericata]
MTNENKLYYVNDDENYNWDESLIECLKLNMELVTIETSKEQEALNALLTNTNIFTDIPKVYIGGRMNKNTRNYIWTSTGKEFNYTYWNYDKTHFNYECILSGWAGKVEWTDIGCSTKYGYICEQQQQQENELKLQEIHEKLKETLRIEEQKRENLQQALNKNLTGQLQILINDNKLKNHDLKEINEKYMQQQILLEKTLQDMERKLQQILLKQQECQQQQQMEKILQQKGLKPKMRRRMENIIIILFQLFKMHIYNQTLH